MKYVALCTTMWEDGQVEMAKVRENQLRETYWKGMISKGAQVMRIRGEGSSAWAAIEAILKRHKGGLNPFTVMSIQRELVDLRRLLSHTEAGRSLQVIEAQKGRMRKSIASPWAEKRSQGHEKQLQRKAITSHYITPWPVDNRATFRNQKGIQASPRQENHSTPSQIKDQDEQDRDPFESSETVTRNMSSESQDRSSITSGTPSLRSSFVNFNPVAAMRAQSSVISFTSSCSSVTTEYGSIYFSRDLSSQSSMCTIPRKD